jgi:hypothetical protein
MLSSRIRRARLAAAFLTLAVAAGAGGAVVFDDSDPSSMVLSGDRYAFRFSKENGAILSVVDASTGLELSQGSRNGCLWGASRPPSAYEGSCSPGRSFGYVWDPEASVLAMTWSTGESGHEARVTVTASDSNWLDMKLEMTGSPTGFDYVHFPSDVMFRDADVRQVLLPVLPGVVLESGFFAENRSYSARYPGEGMFSDFFGLESTAGRMSIYTVSDRVHPAVVGVIHDEEAGDDRSYYAHAFAVRIPDGQRWISPTVRWRIGTTFAEAARAFREDNGIDALPSLESRLGGLYPRIIRAPLLKIDMETMRRPFDDYERLLRELPVPSLLHWVAFGERGFDEDYPDFLPPHPSHGTTRQFADLFLYARALGHLNMPYTNPTWWDDESPTVRALPAEMTIHDIAVRDDSGAARYETYGSKGGYAVSPWHPFVRDRADESVTQMTRDVPSDLLFQDQIGARPWMFDTNPSSPSPTAYIDGWLDHTARHGGEVLLGTEQGFDALIPNEVAFFGSVPGEDTEWSDARWGSGNWSPWPFVPIVAGDKVLLYPHNMGANRPGDATFRLNVAFGQMMMYTLRSGPSSVFDPSPGGGLDVDAFRIVSALQPNVIARYATTPIDDFAWIAPRVTRTRFRTAEVIANADSSASFEYAGHVVLPGGFLVLSDDGLLTAGVVDRWNALPLEAGRHVVVEVRSETGISVWKPAGPASNIVVRGMEGWTSSTPVEARAIGARGEVVRTVPVTMTPYGVLFRYSPVLDDRLVDHFEVVDTTRLTRRRGVRH